MKGSMLKTIVIIIVLFLLSPLSSLGKNNSIDDKKTINYDGGWLEEKDGVRILHISGSNYDMGYQHGELLRDQVQQNLRAMISYSSSTPTRPWGSMPISSRMVWSSSGGRWSKRVKSSVILETLVTARDLICILVCTASIALMI